MSNFVAEERRLVILKAAIYPRINPNQRVAVVLLLTHFKDNTSFLICKLFQRIMQNKIKKPRQRSERYVSGLVAMKPNVFICTSHSTSTNIYQIYLLCKVTFNYFALCDRDNFNRYNKLFNVLTH